MTVPWQITRWTREALVGLPAQVGAAIPRIGTDDRLPMLPGYDLWDMWQIARVDGSTVVIDARSWWFFLETPRLDDPELRHDDARIRLMSRGADGWRDHGRVFPEGFTPGSREWSGSSVLQDDGRTLTMYFTAAGRRGEPRTFEQRLFATQGTFTVESGTPRIIDWTPPHEIVGLDRRWYAPADEVEAPAHGIRGCRDPGFFRDPADGRDYLLFTANHAVSDTPVDGVIGVAARDDARWGEAWCMMPPLVSALGVNSELERAHIVLRAGFYYLFWSTQRRRFGTGIDAPTGLYGMVAERFAGPWRPLNGTGLVAANPLAAPMQAYCWWVTGECEVLSFIDYHGDAITALPKTVEERRAAFGGTVAPIFRLHLDGDRAMPVF